MSLTAGSFEEEVTRLCCKEATAVKLRKKAQEK